MYLAPDFQFGDAFLDLRHLLSFDGRDGRLSDSAFSNNCLYSSLVSPSCYPHRLADNEQYAPDCGPLLGFVQAHAYG